MRNFVNTGFYLLKLTWNSWLNHNAGRIGAALACYTLLSLSPIVVLATAAGSVFFGNSTTKWHLIHQVQQLVGSQVATVIQAMMDQARPPGVGSLESVLGLVTLAVGASGLFVELRSALNTMWDIPPHQNSGFLDAVKERLLAVGMILIIGILLIGSILIGVVLSLVGNRFEGRLAIPIVALEVSNFVISFIVLTVLFGLVLRFVPEAKLQPRDIWVGAIVSALIFTTGKWLIGLYLGRVSIGSLFGEGGSIVVVLAWVYYSAQLFLFGAEFARVQGQYRRDHPKR